MPHYNTLDRRTNLSELDPSLAAKIRLKNNKHFKWACIAIGVTFLALIVAGAVLVLVLTRSSREEKSDQQNSTQSTSLQPEDLTGPNAPPKSADLITAPPIDHPTEPPETHPVNVPIQTTQEEVSPAFSHRRLLPGKVDQIQTGSKFLETCDDYLKAGFTRTGVYRLIRPNAYDFLAQCVMNEEDGKAWIVLQKRTKNELPFWNQSFEEYSKGFGDTRGDHWLGLKHVRSLIEADHKLRLKMEIEGDACDRKNDDFYYVGTWDFEIESEQDDYRLHVSSILSGNFTDPLSTIGTSNGLPFTALYRNGISTMNSCAGRLHLGAWWIGKGGCPFLSLNGEYSCPNKSKLYGLAVYYRQSLQANKGGYATGYFRPHSTRMMLRICGPKEC